MAFLVSKRYLNYAIIYYNRFKVVVHEANKTYMDLDGCFKQTSEWILETEGSNMREVLDNHEIPIDTTRIFSNNIAEMASVCLYSFINVLSCNINNILIIY